LEPQSDSDTRNSLLGTSRGLNYLLKKVDETLIEAKSTGFVSRESIKFLARNSGQSWNGFSGKQALLAALEDEKADINARKPPLEEEELNQRNARLDSAALPGKGALDGIHRYETSNVRHRYKVEKRLHELQSRRQEQDDVSGAHNAMVGNASYAIFCETKPICILVSAR